MTKMKADFYLRPLALSLSAFLNVALSLSITSSPVVDLGYAKYQGNFNATGNATFFIGIRYAAPPTGTMALLHNIALHPDAFFLALL